VAAEQDWTFAGAWPYEPRWFDSRDGRMHYVDEGPRDGRPVVLVHGNPTWGFLYRHFVGPLVEAGHRAIVPDHLGFGRSDKPDRPELYRIPRHVERLDALLESLDLQRATVVPQDWGGPIGLSWAVAHPERVERLFILNTYAHRPRGKVPLPVPLRLFRTPGVGEVLVKGLHAFVRGFLFRAGVAHRDRLTHEVKQAYLAPHPTWSSRTSILVFPREIPSGPDSPLAPALGELEHGLERHFRDRPVAFAWAMKDPAFTPQMLELWRTTFPDASVLRLDDASHYLQEDAYERIVPELLGFLDR
jgi:pimeloyl-ACP methyl ester carboxylesterase